MRKIILYFLIILSLAGCAGKKVITTKQQHPKIPEQWKLKIKDVDVSNYPHINMRAIVEDSSGNIVKNLAPPFGHLNDWQYIWEPLIQQHPRWGKSELQDFKVIETQFECIDTTKLEKFKREKNEIEIQIAKGREAFQGVIERIKVRKKQLHTPQKELMAKTTFVLVMDVSGSMSGEPLQKAKMAAAEFVEFSDAEIAVIAFASRVDEITSFSRDKNKLTSSVLQLQSGGGTHLYDALHHALTMLKSKTGEKHIIALTDGQTSGDRYSLQDIINFARSGDVSVVAQTGELTKLFTIGLGYSGEDLKKLSEQTGGKYYYSSSPNELLDVFSAYVGFRLEYTRTAIDLSPRLHEINMEIENIYTNILKIFHYDISFTSSFPVKDGLIQQISFRFGDNIIQQKIKTPVSKKEMVVIGSVIDKETKEKIQKATVNINPQNIDTTFSTQTDSLGNFELKTLKANTKYTLFVYAKDYFVASKELWLAKPDSYYVKLQLSAPKVEIGCVATIRTIHFENNEFLFEPISFPDLMIMGRYLVQHPEFKLEIGGHTDSTVKHPIINGSQKNEPKSWLTFSLVLAYRNRISRAKVMAKPTFSFPILPVKIVI